MENSSPDKNSRAVDGVIQENHDLVVVKAGTGNPETGSQGTDNPETDSPGTGSQGIAIIHVDKETNEITDKDSKELLTSEMGNIIMMFRLPFADELYKGVIFRC